MPADLSNMNLQERAEYLEMKERYKKKLAPWYKKWWGITIIVIIGLILILTVAAGFYVYQKYREYQATSQMAQQFTSQKALDTAISGPGTNYYLGSDKPQLTIVEFSDFACPYCQEAHSVLAQIVKKYPNQVKIVFRDLPLHENSVSLALAARCAGEQGKFWEMHDQLFSNQSILTGTGDTLKTAIYGLAGTIGLNAANFDSCYQDQKYLSNIKADYDDATALQLQGTPSWFLNGKLITGYIPADDFMNLLATYFSSSNTTK
jgi:protein-disulfide isomerase